MTIPPPEANGWGQISKKKKEDNFQKSSPLLLHVGEKDSMHGAHEALYLICEIYGPWISDSGHRKGLI